MGRGGRRRPEGRAATATRPRGAPGRAGGDPGRAGARPAGRWRPLCRAPPADPAAPAAGRGGGGGEGAGRRRNGAAGAGRRGGEEGAAALGGGGRRPGRLAGGCSAHVARWGWPCCFPPGEAGWVRPAGRSPRGGGSSRPAGRPASALPAAGERRRSRLTAEQGACGERGLASGRLAGSLRGGEDL